MSCQLSRVPDSFQVASTKDPCNYEVNGVVYQTAFMLQHQRNLQMKKLTTVTLINAT
jgi:hypothetical protein